MNIGDIRMPQVIVAYPDQPLAQAARMMRVNHVGALVVLDPKDPGRKPIGMLTDRDVLLGQLRKSADLHCLNVGDVMSSHPMVLSLEMELAEAIEAMNSRAVRRAPIVDGQGSLAGIVSLDDLLPALAHELGDLASLMALQGRAQTAR